MVEMEPESGLREVVHQRVRLGVLAVLARQGPCTFSQLRDALGQSDGGLSRHLGVLEEHGYITTEKVFENRRPRTWVHLTTSGTEAFAEEQELLGKLLARTEHGGGDDDTTAMTIVFAALLAGEDDEDSPGDDRSPGDMTDRSTLVPTHPSFGADRPARQIASGPISARYDFPDTYRDFGTEQREQRLMLLSHGLRGGWITTWRDDGGQDDDLTAHAMVVELGAAHDCEAILAVMGPPTVDLPETPAARGYLFGGGDEAPATAVAWFSTGPFLASVVVIGTEAGALMTLENLVVEVHEALPRTRS